VKVESWEIIYIRLEWEPNDPLRAEWYQWIRTENIVDPCPISSGGPKGASRGYYKPEAERIFAWLREHGVEVPKPHDHWPQ
jgi:hypothetical protein